MAVWKGHLDIVRILLDRSANLDAANKNGFTPLISAAGNCHLDIVRILLDRSANVDAANKNGCNPLSFAAQFGHLDVVRLLIDRSAKVDAANKKGRTPLIKAAAKGHLDCVRVLVERSANVDTRNKWGDTALQVAKKKDVRRLCSSCAIVQQTLAPKDHSRKDTAVPDAQGKKFSKYKQGYIRKGMAIIPAISSTTGANGCDLLRLFWILATVAVLAGGDGNAEGAAQGAAGQADLPGVADWRMCRGILFQESVHDRVLRGCRA